MEYVGVARSVAGFCECGKRGPGVRDIYLHVFVLFGLGLFIVAFIVEKNGDKKQDKEKDQNVSWRECARIRLSSRSYSIGSVCTECPHASGHVVLGGSVTPLRLP